MNLEELREVRRTERQRDGLQSLPESFYSDVATYIADLKAERNRAAETADDPFSDPEIRRLTDEIESAEEVVQSIYERRVGKVVERASFAAADMAHDEEGLTAEERDLFDDLVARIERNRERVLDALDPTAAGAGTADATDADVGDAAAPPDSTDAPADRTTDRTPPDPSASSGRAADPESGTASADAPDPSDLLTEAMGGSADETGGAGRADETDRAAGADAGAGPSDADGPAARDTTRDPGQTGDPERTAGASTGQSTPADSPDSDAAASGGVSAAAAGTAPTDAAPESPAGSDRTTVYVTRDVGEIFGADERTYSLAAEDVVDLPSDNAQALVERDAAKPLE